MFLLKKKKLKKNLKIYFYKNTVNSLNFCVFYHNTFIKNLNYFKNSFNFISKYNLIGIEKNLKIISLKAPLFLFKKEQKLTPNFIIKKKIYILKPPFFFSNEINSFFFLKFFYKLSFKFILLFLLKTYQNVDNI